MENKQSDWQLQLSISYHYFIVRIKLQISYQVNLDFMNRVTKLLRMVYLKLDLPLLNKSRKTNKGKLGQIVMKEIDTTETLEVKKEHTAYIVDFMALIRTITKYLIHSKDLRGKWYLVFQRVTVVSILLLIANSKIQLKHLSD